MHTDTPRGVRPHGRTGAAALAAASVLATGAVIIATPAAAFADNTPVLSGLVASPAAFSGPTYASGSVRLTRSYLTSDRPMVQLGQKATLSGKLTYGPGERPVRTYPVRLEENDGGTWKTVDNGLVNADGSVTFTVAPTRSTSYRLAYIGAAQYGSSVSAEQTIAVKLPPPPPVPRVSTVSTSSSARSTVGAGGIGSAHVAASAAGAAAVAAAAAQSGKPYVFAAAGPNAFDCSGLTLYVFRQFGINLPHDANAQQGYGVPVPAAQAAPGDLMIFLDGGYGYHVAIYAGGNSMYDAPNSNQTVGLHQIWSTNVVFRRLV